MSSKAIDADFLVESLQDVNNSLGSETYVFVLMHVSRLTGDPIFTCEFIVFVVVAVLLLLLLFVCLLLFWWWWLLLFC